MSSKDVEKEICGCQDHHEIYKQLKVLFMSAYSFEGIPDTINQDFLWRQMLLQGRIAFYKDPVLDKVVCLNGNNQNKADINGEALEVRLSGHNGYTKVAPNYRSVISRDTNENMALIMYNDLERSTPAVRLEDFAKRIYNCDRTCDMNVFAQRTPVLIEAPKGQELTLKAIFQKFRDFAPAIFMRERNKTMDFEPLKVIKTDAPVVFMDIDDYKRRLWNEALSYIGIENNFSEKSERLVSGEVLVSNGLSIAMKQIRVTELNKTLDMLKEMYPEDFKNAKIIVNNVSLTDIDGDPNDGQVEEGDE